MSGFSPFSIKSVRGRTFTDKNASLPGSRSQQFSYKLPGQQSWLHKPFLENVGVNRVAAEFQDRFCCNGNSDVSRQCHKKGICLKPKNLLA